MLPSFEDSDPLVSAVMPDGPASGLPPLQGGGVGNHSLGAAAAASIPQKPDKIEKPMTFCDSVRKICSSSSRTSFSFFYPSATGPNDISPPFFSGLVVAVPQVHHSKQFSLGDRKA